MYVVFASIFPHKIDVFFVPLRRFLKYVYVKRNII